MCVCAHVCVCGCGGTVVVVACGGCVCVCVCMTCVSHRRTAHSAAAAGLAAARRPTSRQCHSGAASAARTMTPAATHGTHTRTHPPSYHVHTAAPHLLGATGCQMSEVSRPEPRGSSQRLLFWGACAGAGAGAGVGACAHRKGSMLRILVSSSVGRLHIGPSIVTPCSSRDLHQ